MKFQNPSIHHSKVNTHTDAQTHRRTDKPKAICPSNFFKVGGIMSHVTRKPDFYLCKTKAQISCAVTAQLISAFVFATWIVQFLLYLYSKFQDSSLLMRLYRSVCAGPGRKPQSPVFSCRGPNETG